MDDNERRRIDMLIRVRQFGIDNAADFPANSVGAAQFALLTDLMNDIEQFAEIQATSIGDARQLFVNKQTARENLREDLYEIVRTARSMEYQFNGITAKFRMPRSQNDQNLLSIARAFYDQSEQFNADFTAYGMDANFRAALETAIDEFDMSLNPPATAIDGQVAATAELGDAVGRGMIARRVLDGVVKNKYKNNVGKLSAWLSASYIERPPKNTGQ